MELVADGRAAIEAFDVHPPSVALVDLHMPGLGGSELIEVLRSRPGAQNVPIVVLTGSGGPSEWRRLSKLGADGFLVKPVNGTDVAMLMRRVLVERARQTPLPEPIGSVEDAGDEETLVRAQPVLSHGYLDRPVIAEAR